MSQKELNLIYGFEIPIDVVRFQDGYLKVITNHDIALYQLGLSKNPYSR